MIQQSINQAAGILTALYTQTPNYEQMKREKAKQSELRSLEQQTAEGKQAYDILDEAERQGYDVSAQKERLQTKFQKNMERRAELDPSKAGTYAWLENMAAEDLTTNIERNIAQKDRVSDFYNSLKGETFIHEVNKDISRARRDLNLDKEVKDGKSNK